ncbi:predicted protein [Sclerotinia sclerotiorum 1980 UF-70]|uniref:Uncharacterized protein n=1 Tax=Sclerotinia sclerotiorum (strain ATCC 18683 / 1980 / Ss-1) TaxID=665079 RepID=A7EBM3_SCLS1|nr:predicted protein [Sclerotinia sclerotiorum 1980 UF-70]EDN99851.1 predicted protein [Sclerotinia sclerotiorum 1980 UF-70]
MARLRNPAQTSSLTRGTCNMVRNFRRRDLHFCQTNGWLPISQLNILYETRLWGVFPMALEFQVAERSLVLTPRLLLKRLFEELVFWLEHQYVCHTSSVV